MSVMLAIANPATARVLEELGASTLNVTPDLSLAQIAAIRAAVDVRSDVYSGPGGCWRVRPPRTRSPS